jgi:lipopolysaccharide transport system permease protein
MLKEQPEADVSAPRLDSVGARGDAVVSPPALPSEPLIKIRAGRSRITSELKEAWTYSELLYFLVWRDLKVRYRQTSLGVAWVILHPLLMALVFTVFMGTLARVPSEGVPYPLFAYAGVLLWTFFSNSVSTSGYSLIANSSMITKVFFPRALLPVAVTGVRLVDFLFASLVLFAMMIYYGVGAGWGLLLLPLLLAQATLLTLAVGLWFSALITRYRDVGTLLPVLLQVWMFASPVIYPSSLVPERWRWIYLLNPMAGLLEGFRASLFGLEFDWVGMGLSAAVTLSLLAYFVRAFHRMQENLVDTI